MDFKAAWVIILLAGTVCAVVLLVTLTIVAVAKHF
jgi:hypothetical protein